MFSNDLKLRRKDRALDEFGRAVKQIQEFVVRSGQESLQLTNHDSQFQGIVEILDYIFHYGLKDITHGCWLAVKQFTHKATLREIYRLENVTTNMGRGRAWIYLALMEHVLSSYVSCFENNRAAVLTYYKLDAIMVDVEMLSILNSLLLGLECVVFQLELDVPYLDLCISEPAFRDTMSFAEVFQISTNDVVSASSANPSVTDAVNKNIAERSESASSEPANSGDYSSLLSVITKDADDELYVVQRVKGRSGRKKNNLRQQQRASEEIASDDVSISGSVTLESGYQSTMDQSAIDQSSTSSGGHDENGSIGLVEKEKEVVISAPSSTWYSLAYVEENDLLQSTEESINKRSSTVSDNSTDLHSGGDVAIERSKSSSLHRAENPSDNQIDRHGDDDKILKREGHGQVNEESRQSTTLQNEDISLVNDGDFYAEDDSIFGHGKNIGTESMQSFLETQAVSLNKFLPNNNDTSSKKSTQNDDENPFLASGDQRQKDEISSENDLGKVDSNKFTSATVNGDDCEPSIYDVRSNVDEAEDSNSHLHSAKATKPYADEDNEIGFKFARDRGISEKDISKSLPSENGFPHQHGSQQQQAEMRKRHSHTPVSPKRQSQQDPDNFSVSMDNNAKLALMLEVFQEQDESLHTVFRVTEGHTGGLPQPVLLVVTDRSLYIVTAVYGHRKFNTNIAVTFRELDYISVGLNSQYVNVVCTNRRKQYWVTLGNELLTRAVLTCLQEAVSKCTGSALTVLTDCTTQKIALRKWAARECRSEDVQDVNLVSYTLVHWEDLQMSRPSVGVDVGLGTIVKEDLLMYRPPNTGLWRSGYFRLQDGIIRVYNAQHDNSPPQLTVNLREECAGCRRSTNSDRPHSFEVLLSNGLAFLLAATTEDELNDWLQNLCRAVSGGVAATLAGRQLVACCCVLTDDQLLLCHEDVETSAVRTLAAAQLTDVTEVLVDSSAHTFCILVFESQSDAIADERWALHFYARSERDNFLTNIGNCWKTKFEVELPVSAIEDIPLQRQCRESASRLRINLHL